MVAVAENIKVPELRFPEFSRRWEELSLAAISSKITSGARDWARFYAEEGELFLRMTNLPREGVQLLLSDMKYVKLPAQNQEASRTSVASGDILMSITAELGKIGFVTSNESGGYINQHTALIRPKHVHSSKFLAQHLSSWQSRIRINRLNDSGAKASLNLKTVGKVLLSTPEFAEQQKIADFLTAVDERIAKLKRKKELLEEYKKGMMQKLFSQEIRFKDEDGKDFPDWEEKQLGTVVKKTSSNLAMGDLEGNEGNFKVYGASGEVGTYSSYQQKVEFIGVVKDGAGVGRLILCERFSSVLGTMDILKNSEESTLNFMFQLLHTVKFHRFVTGSTIPHIYFRDYQSLKKEIPNLLEQQKIAEFLTGMDDKITAVANQLDKAAEFKRGLLQKMFV